MLKPLLQAMRPHQWVKNLLVFAPLVFAHRFYEWPAWRSTILAFAVFCAACSGIYLLNDMIDREADRRHPRKRNRPIASGRLPMPIATIAMASLLAAALGVSLVLGPEGQSVPFAVWPAAYLVLNLAYSVALKRMVVLDCMCIAAGFQIRVHAGAVVLAEPTSSWILMCTFFFALFLAFCKRREEVRRQADAAGETRATMRAYDLPFLDQVIGPSAALSILSYALYTLAPEVVKEQGNLSFTVPFVVFGVFRYMFLVYRRDEGGDPAKLLFKDPVLVLSGVLYAVTLLLILR